MTDPTDPNHQTATAIVRKALKPLFTLFDSAATPECPKLDDVYVLELSLLYDYTTASTKMLARGFDLPEGDVVDFFAHPRTGPPSVARSWFRALNISNNDRAALRNIVASAANRLQASLDTGENYVEGTQKIFVALALGEFPGAETAEDLEAARKFYMGAADAVEAILDRAAWPEPDVEEGDADLDDDDFTDDEDCEVIDLLAAQEVATLPDVADGYLQRALQAQAWHFTAH